MRRTNSSSRGRRQSSIRRGWSCPALVVVLVAICLPAVAQEPERQEVQVPGEIRETLDLIFKKAFVEGESAWESYRRQKTDAYDISPFLQTTKSVQQAARRFGIPPILVGVASEQLAEHGQAWEGLSIGERHRLLDYLLVVYRGTRDKWYGPVYMARVIGIGTEKVQRLARYAASISPSSRQGVSEGIHELLVRPGLFAVVDLLGTGGSPQVRVALLTREGVSTTEFPRTWGARGDIWGPVFEGVWDGAMDDKGEIGYFVVRNTALFTTQEPCMLLELKVKEHRCFVVKVPWSGLLSCVAVSRNGELAVVGTEAGEVLQRHGDGKWVLEQVFKEDVVRELAIRAACVIAVSERGGVARFDKNWEVIRKPGDVALSGCAVRSDGNVFLRFADGQLLTVSQKETAKVDYRALLPKARGALFQPKGLFRWGDDICLWGSLENRLTFIEFGSGRSWTVDVPVRREFLYTEVDMKVTGAWSASEVIWVHGLSGRVANRDGKISEWQPYDAYLETRGIGPAEKGTP